MPSSTPTTTGQRRRRRRAAMVPGGSVVSEVDMPRGSGGDHQPATDATADPVARMRRAVLAGHRGDLQEARLLSDDPVPSVRSAALGALARLDALDVTALERCAHDTDASVRRRACLEAGRALGAGSAHDDVLDGAVDVVLDRLAHDGDAAVVECAAWALGEAGRRCPRPGVDALVRVARAHPDPLAREAAVAVLGALGDRPAVRRRAAIALAAFDDPRAEAGLRRCLADRDWQVRQAAEDLLGPQTSADTNS